MIAAAAALALIVATGSLVAPTFRAALNPFDRPPNLDEALALQTKLIASSDKVDALQKETNAARRSIRDAFDALDSILNLGRTAEGIPQAQAEFPKAADAMAVARKANVRLPDATRDLLRITGQERRDVARVIQLVEAPVDIRYLKAFDKALALLVETNESYVDVNAKMAETMIQYESLITAADGFLKSEAARTYRNKTQAAQVFSRDTEALAAAIETLRGQVDQLDSVAISRAQSALVAFREAAALRPRNS